MILNAKRLILRSFKESDLESFLEYRNDAEVSRYQGWSVPYAREQGLRFLAEMKDVEAPKQGQWLQLAIELKNTGEMIGDVGAQIKHEDARQAVIGFTVVSSHWRNGYGVEAIRCLLEFLFDDLDLHRVTADCDVENVASYRTLEKLGFRREAHFVESYLVGRVYTSEFHYGMLQREWREKKLKS
ncbi:MAG: GNAT family N-acetyltransferase [Anaerolineales bacterium]